MELDVRDGGAQLLFRVLVEGVEVVLDAVVEEHRILHDNGQPRSKTVQLELGDVDAVDGEGACAVTAIAAGGFDEAPECRDECRLAGAGTPHDAHLGAWLNGAVDVAEGQRQLGTVANAEVLHHDAALGGPDGRGHRLASDLLLGRVSRVLEYALNGCESLLKLEGALGPELEEGGELKRVRDAQPKGGGGSAHRAAEVDDEDRQDHGESRDEP
mmetsp:Transcript_44746/g.89344  ORF Transcript_44746/g.89344 Transcript_44746/m.89344 type:complete len:214 (-) Transcript_44746:1428-2069(-)